MFSPKSPGNQANFGSRCLFLERSMLTYDFHLPPGPRTVEYAVLAEDLGFRAVWCPEVPPFGHDIWVTLARIAENVLKPSAWDDIKCIKRSGGAPLFASRFLRFAP
jgi:hypothetical protein